MSEPKQSVVVSVYRDATKAELLQEIPIIDLGVQTADGVRPTGDEGFIHIAKHQIRATRTEDADSLFYEVRK